MVSSLYALVRKSVHKTSDNYNGHWPLCLLGFVFVFLNQSGCVTYETKFILKV